MNQIIVGKDVAYAAKAGGGTIANFSELDLLADGAIAVFTENHELVTAVNVGTILLDKKRIYIASGSNPNTGATPLPAVDLTIQITRLGANYLKKDYVAPVKVVKFIGQNTAGNGSLNLPAPLVAGTEAFIRITDLSPALRTTGENIRRYSTLVISGDTATTIATRLINAINADTDGIVTAVIVGAGLGIQLTAKNFGVTFAISLDGIYSSADKDESESPTTPVSNAVAVNYGNGVDTQVLAIEDAFSAQKGNTNKLHQAQLWWTKPTKVVAAETYDMYEIHWAGTKDTSTGKLNTVTHEVIVAIPDGAAAQATFETIMAEAFGNTETVETGA